MTFIVIDKSTGKEIPANQVFLNQESDGGSASLETTLLNLLENYKIGILYAGSTKPFWL